MCAFVSVCVYTVFLEKKCDVCWQKPPFCPKQVTHFNFPFHWIDVHRLSDQAQTHACTCCCYLSLCCDAFCIVKIPTPPFLPLMTGYCVLCGVIGSPLLFLFISSPLFFISYFVPGSFHFPGSFDFFVYSFLVFSLYLFSFFINFQHSFLFIYNPLICCARLKKTCTCWF
jgi:hypothetical protein